MTSHEKGFVSLEIQPGKLYEYDDGNYVTLISGFTPDSTVILPAGYTHCGVVVEGTITLKYGQTERTLGAGDYFSTIEETKITSNGLGMVNSAKGYRGINTFGGPLEKQGRLRYIDGCTDTLLLPPLRKGDPCLNHLHFPENITQTPHTHPSVRTGVIYRGKGVCLIPEENKVIPLVPGYAFVIKTGTLHSFNTEDSTMDVIAFHPDSDVGVTDDDHPMVNRTMVEGISAKFKENIRTQESVHA